MSEAEEHVKRFEQSAVLRAGEAQQAAWVGAQNTEQAARAAALASEAANSEAQLRQKDGEEYRSEIQFLRRELQQSQAVIEAVQASTNDPAKESELEKALRLNAEAQLDTMKMLFAH